MAQRVAGELYESITGQLFELGRQLRQPNGYPFNPMRLKQELQNLIEGRFADGAVFPYIFTCDGVKASELVKRGKYDWVNDLITDKLFPIEKHASVSRTIELVEFDHDPSSEEVLAEFRSRGLKRPSYEDALVFGIVYPEEQRKHPVVFLHEPVVAVGSRFVLVLREDAGYRYLLLHWFGHGWLRPYVFAGLRK